jgi:hypothetical protein
VVNALPAPRSDGWTPERRQSFLTALAEGHTVEAACAHVGLSVASAYALRRRAGGEAFALGWRAACLLGRDRLADILTSRAIDGQVDTLVRADGETVTRHRYDNRLATALLTRLDRLAERAAPPGVVEQGGETGVPVRPDEGMAARAAASDFATFLALIGEGGDAGAVRRFVEAADADGKPQLPQHRAFRKGYEWLADNPELAGDVVFEPWWYDEQDDQYLTYFVPPPNFTGCEYGKYGEPNYARQLTEEEEEAWLLPLPERKLAD